MNDTLVDVGNGVEQRSWLESFSISDGSDTTRMGNTTRITLLVKHNPGREVTGLRIDDNWDANDDSDGEPVHAVTAEQPEVAGGFNYSRVTFAYQAPGAGMDLTCPDLLGGDGVLGRTSQISVRAVLDNGTESEASVSPIKLSREDCGGKVDPPMIYGWEAQDPAGPINPGTEVTFKFRGDDTDESLTTQNKFGGYTWRLRNLDTGEATPGTFVCPGTNQDNTLQNLGVTFPKRGRWVVEAKLHNLDGDLAGNGDCGFNQLSGDYWYWIGAVDVNSPAEVGGVTSPGAILSLPARPGTDDTIAVAVTTNDPFDVVGGGLTQTVEWDLDGDESNGFEVVRYGDSRTGLTPGQDQILVDTSEMSPGFHPVRVRVGDNGALGGADDIRRTNVATGQFMVNTPPVAQDLTVTTDQGTPVALPLTASDTNADGSHDPLSWSFKTSPANGFVSGEWPNRTYHPDQDFKGTESFEYQVADGYGGTTTGTITVTVNGIGSPPDPPDPPAPGGGKQSLRATFDEGRINLNESAGPGTSGVKVVDSAVPDPPVVFDTRSWDGSTGKINAPASDLVFPAKTVQLSITDPLPLDLDVTIEFGSVGNIGGAFDAKTGAMTLDFDAHALITVSAAGLGQVLKCDVTPIPLQLSTGGAALVDPGEGERPAATWTAKAFDATGGAVTSLWENLPQSTAIAEPMAPLATCAETLDGLIGGKGGFWLGGKVEFDRGAGPGADFAPPKGIAVFDGKRLHIRLYCPKVFKPSCKTRSVPVTKKVGNKASRKAKRRAKPMAKPVRVKVKSGKWKVVSYLIKPKFRAKVAAMAGKKKRMLTIRDTVKAKKMGKKKLKGSRTFFHGHKVRAG